MITLKQPGVARVTVALDPIDVDLLDRLAKAEASNRSAELRSILAQLRPMLLATVEAFEAALAQRQAFDELAVAQTAAELEALVPELERIQGAYLGAMARIEGRAAAAEADADPRAGNHGGHTPTPTPDPAAE